MKYIELIFFFLLLTKSFLKPVVSGHSEGFKKGLVKRANTIPFLLFQKLRNKTKVSVKNLSIHKIYNKVYIV